MLRNSLEQMLIEGTPFETRHGKSRRCIPVLPTSFEFGERDCAQTGIEVKVELGLGARLTIDQTGKLFGVSEQKLNWEARFVITVDRQRIQVDICAQENRPPVVFSVDHQHYLEVTLELDMIENLMIEHDIVIFGRDVFNA